MSDIDAFRIAFDPGMRRLLDAALALVIFGVALELTPRDLREVLRRPLGLIATLACQFVLMPAAAFLIARLLGLAPSLALGMLLVASCPGGSVSNLLTAVAGGNTALSMSATAVSTLAAGVLTPLAFRAWGSLDPGTAALLGTLELDGALMAAEAASLVVLPLCAGVGVAALRPSWARALMRPARAASLLFLLALIVAGVGSNLEMLAASLGQAAVIALLGNAAALSIGYGGAAAAGLSERDRRAVAYEVGMQNTGLALAFVFRFFGGLGGMAVVAALWGIWNMIAGTALAAVWSRRAAASAEAAA